MQQILSTLTVEAPVTSIPASIEADISSVSLDTTLRVADLVLPEGVTTLVDPDAAVASAQVTRATLSEGEEAAAAEAAEGEAAEGESAQAGEARPAATMAATTRADRPAAPAGAGAPVGLRPAPGRGAAG